jgi:hypothetical protein
VVPHEKHIDAAVFYVPREVQPGGGLRLGSADHSEPQRSTLGRITFNARHAVILSIGGGVDRPRILDVIHPCTRSSEVAETFVSARMAADAPSAEDERIPAGWLVSLARA